MDSKIVYNTNYQIAGSYICKIPYEEMKTIEVELKYEADQRPYVEINQNSWYKRTGIRGTRTIIDKIYGRA